MLERSKIVTEIVTAWISMFALIVGGCFAGFQYLDKESGDRVKETLTFLTRFNTTPVLDSRRKIDTVWDAGMAQQLELLQRRPFSDDAYREFMTRTLKEGGIAQDVGLVIEYFESLEVCIRAKICDGDAAVQFLGPEALAFFRQHFTYIQSVRLQRNDQRFAHDLEMFSKRRR